ncbi:MAG: hypothetical protein J5J06_13360, partial [Phycisphaerae bacterium]|nr:hypothetical protein [Phycisphaerae bacterium]
HERRRRVIDAIDNGDRHPAGVVQVIAGLDVGGGDPAVLVGPEFVVRRDAEGLAGVEAQPENAGVGEAGAVGLQKKCCRRTPASWRCPFQARAVGRPVSRRAALRGGRAVLRASRRT